MNNYDQAYERAVAKALSDHAEAGVPDDTDLLPQVQERLAEREAPAKQQDSRRRFEWLRGTAPRQAQPETAGLGRTATIYRSVGALAGLAALLLLAVVTAFSISRLSQWPARSNLQSNTGTLTRQPEKDTQYFAGEGTLVFSTEISTGDVWDAIKGFDVAEDGSFWIGDIEKRLRRFSPTGELLNTIELPTRIGDLHDLEIQNRNIWVLGESGSVVVYKLATDGNILAEYPAISSFPGMMSFAAVRFFALRLGGDGQVLIESDNYTSQVYIEVIDAEGKVSEAVRDYYKKSPETSKDYPGRKGKVYSRGQSLNVIMAGDLPVTIDITGTVSNWAIFKVMPDDSFYVGVETVATQTLGIWKDPYHYLMHYDAGGTLIERSLLPSMQPFTGQPLTLMKKMKQLALGPDGALYAVINPGYMSELNQVGIFRLKFYPASEPMPPIPTHTPTPVYPTSIPTSSAPELPAIEPTSPTSPGLPAPVPTSPPAPSSYTGVTDLAFVDTQHGWAIGDSWAIGSGGVPGSSVAIRATGDGGQTWQAVAAPQTEINWDGDRGDNRYIRYIHFANTNDGWVFGPGLFTTHDGGKTWADDTRKGSIVALDWRGGTAWAIERIERTCSAQCSYTLLASEDTGRTWRPAGVQPQMRDAEVQLARITGKDAWILSSGEYEPDVPENSRLTATHDGGETWETLPNPPCLSHITNRLAALAGGELWLLCGGVPGAGQQPKSLYVSPNGGKSWNLIAEASVDGMHNLTMGGYVNDLAVTSPERGWFTLGRGFLSGTTDGGRTWSAPNIPGSEIFLDSGTGSVVFADTLHGWMAAKNMVFRTTNGGKDWAGVQVP